MKKIKIFCSVAFLCAIIAVNISLSGNNSKLSGINLESLFSVAMADGESGGGNEVLCFSEEIWNPFLSFYNCGTCCEEAGASKGESLKCDHIEDDC